MSHNSQFSDESQRKSQRNGNVRVTFRHGRPPRDGLGTEEVHGVRKLRRGIQLGALIAGAARVFAACTSNSASTTTSSGSKATTPTTSSVKSGGNLTFALDEDLAGFNVNTSASSEFVLAEILDVVWPQPFIIAPSLQPELNTQLMESATQTSTSPQTIVYTINPKAVWQDGVPIDGADFDYNYLAQSGNPKYKDVGNKPFDDATTVGYNQVKSLVTSDPPGGAAC